MTAINATKNTSNSYTAARVARQKRRNWAIAAMAGLAAAITVLSPPAAASAHGDERVSPVSTTVGELAPIEATGYTADQFLKWDRARTDASVPSLQTPPATPSKPGAKFVGPKQLAPTTAPTTTPTTTPTTPSTTAPAKVLADGRTSFRTTTTSQTQAVAGDLVMAEQPGSGDIAIGGGTSGGPAVGGSDKVIGNQGTVGSPSDCHIDFNEKSVLNILPDHAQATFVLWPFWLEECNGTPEGNITVRPMEANHYHLGYEDLQISFCSDIGNFGRHTEPRPVNPTDEELLDWYHTPCTEIDPVAETRSAIQPHSPGYTTEIFAYESFGDKLPMTLNSIQIVSGTSEICHLGTGDWIAQEPGDESPWQCMELGPGHWNMSGIADDVIEVRVTALTANNVIDNIAADIL